MENHLIVTTYCEVLESENRKIAPLRIHIENEIPIGRGCGSSAAARLAGIALAVHFGHLRWKNDRIVGEASMREHHPDNASACWMGALTVARMANQVQAQVVEVKPKGKWPLLLAVPDAPLSTEQARRVLPFQYSRADAVTNIQNSMLLLAAFTQDRADLLSSALEDRIHQPYRAPLCPLLPALKELTGDSGILGAALSGAGPSVLVFLDPKVSAKKAKQRIAAHLTKRRLTAELILTRSHNTVDAMEPTGASITPPEKNRFASAGRGTSPFKRSITTRRRLLATSRRKRSLSVSLSIVIITETIGGPTSGMRALEKIATAMWLLSEGILLEPWRSLGY